MSDRTDTSPDALFDGRYRIVRRLGQGGMARVFLAQDESLHRPVAIKVLADRHSDDPHFIERFQREARAAARLNHPNIVQVYDHAQVDGVSYIVQEYVEGETLKELIRREAPLEARRAITIALQILAALRVAHQQGVIHRDVKPQNILVQPDGKVKVADFGIASAGETEMTEAGSIVGTAQYLAPEQARGLAVGPPADLYAVGIVTYEMLSGRVPFEGDAAVTVAMRHVQEAPEPLGDRNPLVPADLESVVMRALAKDPRQRYQSADEMGIDLDRVRQGLPVSDETAVIGAATIAMARQPTETMVAPPLPPREGQAARRPNPNRRRLWILLAILVVIAAGAVAGWALVGGTDGGGDPLPTTTSETAAQVSVPEVVGLTQAEAVAALQRVGLDALVIPVEDAEAPEGEVLAQRPVAGQLLAEGSVVEIEVATAPGVVAVPNVVGASLEEARSALEAAKLIVRILEAASDSVPAGSVIAQSPSAGVELKPGSTVEITVSTGQEQGAIPNVVGMDLTNAENTLIAADMTLGSVSDEPNDAPQGQVIAQSPAAGAAAPAGTAVAVIVSTGPASAPVPSVVNLPRGDAEGQIANAGFAVNAQEAAVTDPGQDGIVISQNPASGSSRPKGSTVTIVVGRYTGVATS
ncbi:MAG: Stk1 family PASTA domain-containing Ser/Thr kinase [Gaiellales bacterium]